MGKSGYGILFTAEEIDENNTLLKPYYLLEGSMLDGETIVDQYENTYAKMRFLKNIGAYQDFYGFGISATELVNYYKKVGFDSLVTDYPDVCANHYLEFVKKNVYILEKRNGIDTFNCYAVDLNTKSIVKVDINQDLLSQLGEGLQEEFKISKENPKSSTEVRYYPKDLYRKVTKRVVGQNEAAKVLIGTFCNNLRYSSYEGMMSNILLYGPTGSGKTELIRSLFKEIDIPYVIEDMSSLTASGYVGDSVKSIFRKLYTVCNNDMEKAEHGVIVLDEFDKLATPDPKQTVNKKDVQEELLKVMEGAKINLNDTNKTDKVLLMDTSKIMFILGGAFSEMEQRKPTVINGFSNGESNSNDASQFNLDLEEYGIIPELIGRIPVKIPLHPHSVESLEGLLMKSSISCLTIYEEALLKEDNVRVVYENKQDFVHKIAIKAFDLGVGARGLKTVVDKTFFEATTEIGDEACYQRELFIPNDMVDNPHQYVLRKVRRDIYELPARVGEGN